MEFTFNSLVRAPPPFFFVVVQELIIATAFASKKMDRQTQEEEDASMLKFGPGSLPFLQNQYLIDLDPERDLSNSKQIDFQGKQCLLNSEVAILLEHRQQTSEENEAHEMSK